MSKRPITPEDLLRFQWVADPWIHPDGERVLFSLKRVESKCKVVSQLWVAGPKEAARQLTFGEEGASHGRWSPDGQRIAFLAKRGEAGSQIHLLPMDGGEAQRLTSFPEGSLSEFQWSPDGRWLVARFREAHPDWTEAAKKRRQELGLSDAPWVIETVFYRLDGDGIFGDRRHALYLVDSETGSHRLLYDQDPTGMGSFCWAADSSSIYVVRPRPVEVPGRRSGPGGESGRVSPHARTPAARPERLLGGFSRRTVARFPRR